MKLKILAVITMLFMLAASGCGLQSQRGGKEAVNITVLTPAFQNRVAIL